MVPIWQNQARLLPRWLSHWNSSKNCDQTAATQTSRTSSGRKIARQCAPICLRRTQRVKWVRLRITRAENRRAIHWSLGKSNSVPVSIRMLKNWNSRNFSNVTLLRFVTPSFDDTVAYKHPSDPIKFSSAAIYNNQVDSQAKKMVSLSWGQMSFKPYRRICPKKDTVSGPRLYRLKNFHQF